MPYGQWWQRRRRRHTCHVSAVSPSTRYMRWDTSRQCHNSEFSSIAYMVKSIKIQHNSVMFCRIRLLAHSDIDVGTWKNPRWINANSGDIKHTITANAHRTQNWYRRRRRRSINNATMIFSLSSESVLRLLGRSNVSSSLALPSTPFCCFFRSSLNIIYIATTWSSIRRSISSFAHIWRLIRSEICRSRLFHISLSPSLPRRTTLNAIWMKYDGDMHWREGKKHREIPEIVCNELVCLETNLCEFRCELPMWIFIAATAFRFESTDHRSHQLSVCITLCTLLRSICGQLKTERKKNKK